MGRVLTSWARSVVAWVLHPKIHVRPISCSSGCQSWYSATTRCSFSSHFVLTKIRTSSHRGYFVFSFLFLALGPYTPEGIKIIIIIIIIIRMLCFSYSNFPPKFTLTSPPWNFSTMCRMVSFRGQLHFSAIWPTLLGVLGRQTLLAMAADTL